MGEKLSPNKQVKRIGIIFIGFDRANLPALSFLLLQMNTIQTTFEYEILPARQEFELIKMLSTNKLVNREQARAQAVPFIEDYEVYLHSESVGYDLQDTTLPDRLVLVTMTKFSDNYYTMRQNRLSVVALGNWKTTMAPPSIIEFILTLVVREATAALSPKTMRGSIHYGTKGCLFDFTSTLNDARYKVLNAFICSNCRSVLANNGLPNLADEVVYVLGKKWLGNVSDPSSPAGVAAKLGYHLFVTKGLEASGWEKITNALKEEGVKQLLVL